MFTKKKSRLTRFLAAILAVLMVTYYIPAGLIQNVFAQVLANQDVFTLEILDDGNPVANQEVSGVNANKELTVKATTGNDGVAAFPDVTNTIFGENNKFDFTVGSKTFSIYLSNGTKDHYVYDLATGEVTPVKYNVNLVQNSGSGKLTLNGTEYTGPVQFAPGNKVPFQIKPDTGYEIQTVKIGDGDTITVPDNEKDTYSDTINGISKNTTIEVTYALKNYHVTLNSFQNGTVTDANGQPVQSGSSVTAQYGSTPVYTVTSDKGYHIEGITIGDTAVELPTNATQKTVTLPQVAGDSSITVTFAINNYTIKFYSHGNGTMYNEQNEIIDSAGGQVIVEHDSTPSFLVKPTVGNHVEDITVGGKSVYHSSEMVTKDVPYTFDKVEEDQEVTVTFAINTYNITKSTDGNGKIDLDQPKVNYDGQVNVTVTPNDNSYQLSKLTVDGKDVSFTEDDNGAIVTYSYTITNIQKDTDVKAEFVSVQESSDTWDKYITVTPSKGSLITHYIDKNNNDIRVYSKDAELQISTNTSFDKVDFSKELRNLNKTGIISKSVSIDKLVVKSITDGLKKKINLANKLFLVIDTAKPTVKTPTLSSDQNHNKGIDGADWYNGTVTVDGAITNGTQTTDGVDFSTKIAHVYYSKVSDPADTTHEAVIDQNDNNHYTFQIADQNYHGQYKVWAEDEAGNTTVNQPVMVDVNIDNTKPALASGKAVIFDSTNPDPSLLDKILNFLSFGTYFNQKTEVTVEVTDEASGIQEFTLKAIPKDPSDGKPVPTIDRVANSFSPKGLSATEKFTIDTDSFEGTFAVDVTDKVGNTDTIDLKPDNSNLAANGDGVVMFEKNAPEITLDAVPNEGTDQPYKDKAGNEYYNGNVTYQPIVIDHESGVNNVKLEVNGNKYRDTEYNFSKDQTKQDNPKIADINTAALSGEGYDLGANGSYTVSVVAEDNAGNNNEKQPETRTVFIDTNSPELDGAKDAVTIKQDYSGDFFKFLHFLTFGTYFNQKIEVTVKVKDDISGIKNIALHAVPKKGGEQVTPQLDRFTPTSEDGKTATAVFSLDVPSFVGTLNVVATDYVNNVNKDPYQVTAANSNIEDAASGVVMIEKNAPSATIDVTAKKGEEALLHSYKDDQGKEFYNRDVTFNVPVEDKESGIHSVLIKVNDNGIVNNDYLTKQQIDPIIFPTNTDDTPIGEDGSYHLFAAASDNAGNVIGDPENLKDSDKAYKLDRTIYIDKTAPEITNFAFTRGDVKDVLDKKDIANSVEPTNYGFYFKVPTQVTVTAADVAPVELPKAEKSGVKSITLFVRDYEKNKYYAVLANGALSEISGTDLDKDKIADIVAPISVSNDNEVTFTIPGNFKGQIFAKATDHVNNTGDSLKSPAGEVIEDEAKHKEVSNISLDKAATTNKDNNGLDLYSQDVPVNVTVSDRYSGIAQIDWSVVAPYDKEKNQKGTVTIDNVKNVSGDPGWNPAKTDQNLVTEMTKTILVSNDSNAVVVHVTLTDRVGNTTDKDITFSIDKTAPTFTVTYDNNTPDKQYTDFYKEDRTATIVVTERNFRPEDFQHTIGNKDGGVPKLVGWSTAENTMDPNKTTHTATIKYSADGDYTFDAQYKDNAQNAAAPFNQQTFTLDKTVPVVTVAYNNNSVSNGNYFKAARTATITIKEHNFDPSRVKVAGTASDNGSSAAFPTASGWSTNGDDHTAMIHYSADGMYSFDIDFMDKAGNISADYKTDQFFVDQTAPKLSIDGVKDQSANKGDVIPVISYSDTNFNKNAVSITLSGANRGTVKPDGGFADAPNGQVYTFKNFAKDKKVDDIYTLTANLVDFAGNQSQQTIRFSVNRFGSVYVFADSLKAIEGKYVKHEKDVVLTETNVDTLKHESIKVKMTKNGTPADLAEGKDYTITHSGGDGKWSQYKYTVTKDLFANDGKYTVALYSEDAAGNINENIDETKKAEISFGVDKTAPVIIPVDLENSRQYPVENKSASVSVKDNLVLKGAKIYLNGKKVDQKVDGENYTFSIPSSNSKQNVKIVAVDAAGNDHVKVINDFLVSTNPIVRWYNNTPLFMGSIGGVGVIGALAIFLAVKNMRKEEEDQAN